MQDSKRGWWRRFTAWLADRDIRALVEARDAALAEVERERGRERARLDAALLTGASLTRLREEFGETIETLDQPRLPSWVQLVGCRSAGQDRIQSPQLPWMVGRLLGVVIWAQGVEGNWNVQMGNGPHLLNGAQPLPRSGYQVVTGLRNFPFVRAPNFVEIESDGGPWSFAPGGFVRAAVMLLAIDDDCYGTGFPRVGGWSLPGAYARPEALIRRPIEALDGAPPEPPAPEPEPWQFPDLPGLFPSVEILSMVEAVEAACKRASELPTWEASALHEALEPFQPLLEVRDQRRRQLAIAERVAAELAATAARGPNDIFPQPVGRI